MDEDRAIRFAIPPFFLFASLLWGAYLGGHDLSAVFKPETAKEMFGLLAAAAVAVIPVGFLIGTISVTILRGIARVAGVPTYEAVLSESTLERIWDQLDTTQAENRRLSLYATATFDHELLSPNVHAWMVRRWNAFNVAAHSIVALLLAHLFALVFSIRQGSRWWESTIVLIAILLINAMCSWRETMNMIEFQSHRRQTHTSEDAS